MSCNNPESPLRKLFTDQRNSPVSQLMRSQPQVREIQELALTRDAGDGRYTQPNSLPGIIAQNSGQVDHGQLQGLADDDHSQYHNDTRGDARYVRLSTLTTKGDIYGRSSSAVTRLGVGSNGQVLTADSGAATGLAWATPSTGSPADAQYLTLATNATLTGERVLTAGGGLTGTDAGANNTYTLAVGAGSGITVNADSVALTTPGTLTGTTSNNASGSHTHAITASSAPGATADMLIKTGTTGSVSLESLSLNRALVVNEAGGNYDTRMEGDTNQNLFFLDASEDKIIIGSSTADTRLDDPNPSYIHVIDGNIGISNQTLEPHLNLIGYGNGGPAIRGRQARGTRSSPTAVQAGDVLARVGGGGYTGSAFPVNSTGYFQVQANSNFSGSNYDTRFTIFLAGAGETAVSERLRVTENGISTNGAVNEWEFGGFTAGADAAITGYVTVTINGTAYKLARIT